MTLELIVPGATPVEIERGIAAAWKVFNDAGIPPEEAVAAIFDVEGDDFWISSNGEFGTPCDDADFLREETWWKARDAAIEACCEGWPPDQKPSSAHFEIREAREEGERRTAELRKGVAELEALNLSDEDVRRMIEESEKDPIYAAYKP